MKLLIVDDEKLTREGLRDNIPWKNLNIEEVICADDGVHGLEAVHKYHPNIVISDVRMPRMDGITMAEKILNKYPNTSIIFMSGYSDKEYLMAAIKLNVISYVEKPIDNEEIKESVQDAVRKIEFMRRTKNAENIQRQEQSVRLALSMAQEIIDVQSIKGAIQELNLPITDNAYFTTCILETIEPISELKKNDIREIIHEVKTMISSYKINFLYAQKHNHYLVIHFYSNNADMERSINRCIAVLGEKIKGISDYFVAMGPCVKGIHRVHQSYNEAVILLQSSFFAEKNTVLRKRDTLRAATLDKESMWLLNEAFATKNSNVAKRCAEKIFQGLKDSQDILPCHVKDMYYKCFIQLENAFSKNQILYSSDMEEHNSIWERISACKTLYELHEMFIQQVDLFFSLLDQESDMNPMVYQMKEYIHKNIHKEALSVKEISEYAHLSFSYACTLFKEETGKTLNQYITECRMRIAVQMLENSKYTIEEIAIHVGYSDGNYFGKVFKKMKGLSPSEYREKML